MLEVLLCLMGCQGRKCDGKGEEKPRIGTADEDAVVEALPLRTSVWAESGMRRVKT